MIIPYSVDVVFERYPIANWVLILFTCAVSFMTFGSTMFFERLEPWMLYGSGPWATDMGLLGSFFTHADPIHLFGNMIFLFVFGNAVNAKLGHALFIATYLALGILSGIFSSLLNDVPGLGASGAIFGLTGLFIVMFTKNNVTIFYWFAWFIRGVTEVPAWVAVGFFFLKDIVFYVLELSSGVPGGVGYVAHITGTLAGAGIGLALLMTERILPNEDEITAVEVLGWKTY